MRHWPRRPARHLFRTEFSRRIGLLAGHGLALRTGRAPRCVLMPTGTGMTSDVKFDEHGTAGDGGPEASGAGSLGSDAHASDAAGHETARPDDGPASQRLKQLLDEVVGGLDESYHRYGTVLDDLRSRLHDLSHQTAETGSQGPVPDTAPGGDAPTDLGDAGLQARFDQLTENLESTLNACSPAVLAETMAAETADLEGFDRGADPAPDLQVLQALADRLEGMEGSLRRAEAYAARVEAIEGQLMELIDMIGSPGSQIEQAAQRAAAETAERLKDERQASGAAERLDAIQKELRELNQRANRMDERTSGALDAIGDRLQSLAKRYRPQDRPDSWLRSGANGRKNGNGNGNGYHQVFRMESAGEPIIIGNSATRENGQHGHAGSENESDHRAEPETGLPHPQPYWKKSKPEQRVSVSVATPAGPDRSSPSSPTDERDDEAEIQAAQPQPEISSDGGSSELSRLEILEASLHQVFHDIPDDDRFEMILTRDKPARLRIDNFTHVAMNPDARIYRLIRSTAKGRKILAESEDVAEIGKHVTDYVVGQTVVRQRQRDGFAKHLISAPAGDQLKRRSTSVLLWAFIIGLLTGGCGLFVLGYLLSQ